jgi:hypothetical protein
MNNLLIALVAATYFNLGITSLVGAELISHSFIKT